VTQILPIANERSCSYARHNISELSAGSETDYGALVSTRHWKRVNDQYVKVAKVQGQLAWHKHDSEDEMFLVVYGRLILQFEDKEVALNPGDFYVVPKGTLHNPVAKEECGIVLIETVTTRHTGDVDTPLTKSIEEQLSGI
jgi:mannose-6-phosphate isomerase-like protein (cupin superfamily)